MKVHNKSDVPAPTDIMILITYLKSAIARLLGV